MATVGLQDTLGHWTLPISRVQAKLGEGGEEASIVYLGERHQYLSWTHKFFGQAIEAEDLGTISMFNALQGAGPLASANMVLCPLNPLTKPLFTRRGWRVVPLFVDCAIDLRKSIADLTQVKGAQEDLRVARRMGYTFEHLTNPEALREFYDAMVLPMLKNRHEERAFMSRFETLERLYKTGFLVSVSADGEWIASILATTEGNDTLRLANMGWRDGDKKWPKNGIVGAMLEHSYTWAQNNGYRWINLGASNPFANDGPLNFKLKWGAALRAPMVGYQNGNFGGALSSIGVKLDLQSPATQQMLQSTPLLELLDGRLRAIGWNAKVPPLFRRQVEQGLEWINLAENGSSEAAA